MKAPLFGNRKLHGLEIQENDPDWIKWRKIELDFYYSNQKASLGGIVNNSGYSIMNAVDLSGKRVLEIGPGDINHIEHWKSKPQSYVIADIRQEMIDFSSKKLENNNIQFETKLLEFNGQNNKLPFDNNEFDMIVSFYALEHLNPLGHYLSEFKRLLKKGGEFVGAIPAEGGIAWGAGRFITTRPWLKKNGVDCDKIICWEHPNFSDTILKSLNKSFIKKTVKFWPLGIPVIDFNLVVKFIYENK